MPSGGAVRVGGNVKPGVSVLGGVIPGVRGKVAVGTAVCVGAVVTAVAVGASAIIVAVGVGSPQRPGASVRSQDTSESGSTRGEKSGLIVNRATGWPSTTMRGGKNVVGLYGDCSENMPP